MWHRIMKLPLQISTRKRVSYLKTSMMLGITEDGRRKNVDG